MSYEEEIAAWRAQRLQRLLAEDGWTTLVGLLWLEPGSSRFGRHPDNRLALDYPRLPPHVGSFEVSDGRVSFSAAPGVEVRCAGRAISTLVLASDEAGAPTVLATGSVRFWVIKRGERLGLRVCDSAAPTRMRFRGLEYFPVDRRWRFEARFEPYAPSRKITVSNVLGMAESLASPGALLFEVSGQTYRLDAVLEPDERDYFVMFADRTNGRQSYDAGRFLYVAPPIAGRTVLDFNKAYNPPCAFTPFATCPLPPAHNRLPLAVTAGELRYAGAGH